MQSTSELPLRLTKAKLLKGTPIYQSTVSDFPVYCAEISAAQLYVHDVPEISLVVAGSGVHRVMHQDIPCKKGDIYIVSPDIPHGYFQNEGDEPLLIRRMAFDAADWLSGSAAVAGHRRFCCGVFSENALMAYAVLNASTQAELERLYNAIAHELAEKQSEWRESVRSYLTLFLVTVGRYINKAIKENQHLLPKEWGLLSSAIHLTNTQFSDTTLTLESIANCLYISRSHLSRQFKQLTGNSFTEYLRTVRLEHACKLLAQTECTVEEIIQQCGLRDVPSFYRAFHAHMNMTPHQYRTAQILKETKKHTIQQKGERIMSILNEINENLQRGKAKIVKGLVQQALDEGCAPADILNEGLLRGMNVIGEKFKNNEVYVPEVLVAARAMNMGMEVLKPHLVESGVKAVGRACIGTVQGDLHDIGKNLVRMMLEGKGFEVIDLGTDVAPETFVKTAIEQNCQIICCSALLTTTMNVMADVVKAAEAAGIRDRVKIMVGGAPVTEDYCQMIGADCYTTDAASAADAAAAFCGA